MRYEFSYNGKVISYEIIRKPVKNINIRVKPSGEVFVSCNENVDNKTIELLMIKRANWLINTIEQFKVNLIEFTDAYLKLVDLFLVSIVFLFRIVLVLKLVVSVHFLN